MRLSEDGKAAQLDLPGFSEESEIIGSVFDLTMEDVESLKKRRPKKLGIVCTRSNCQQGLHCFGGGGNSSSPDGACRSCGASVIDWEKVYDKGSIDLDAKIDCFNKEWIRHFFFHLPITGRIDEYARKQGVSGLNAVAVHQFRQGKMLRYMPAQDWKQTPMLNGTIVHWARHATACCCRACMKYWHNIPLSHELETADIDYFATLVMHYVRMRIPNLDVSRKMAIAIGPTMERAKAN